MSTTTLEQLITYLRVNILHDTGGSGVDWLTNDITCRHTNEELTYYAGDALIEVAKRVGHLSTIHPILLSGVMEYTFDTTSINTLDVIEVSLYKGPDKQVLHRLEEAEYIVCPGTSGAVYTLSNAGVLQVKGLTSTEDYTLLVEVNAYPTRLNWDTDRASTLDVPEQYITSVQYYMAHLAFQKDDPDVLSLDRAEEFMGRFQRLIGVSDDMYSKHRRQERRDSAQAAKNTVDYWG